MSLRSKINSAVNKAFLAAGDLVYEGVLSVKNVSSYDFSSRETVSTNNTLAVKVILQSSKKPVDTGFTVSAILKSGIPFGTYDTLVVNNLTYNIVDYDDDGFVITAILTREKT
jgi:hypothetical protein